MEAAQRCDLARHRRRRVALLRETHEEAANALDITQQNRRGDRLRRGLLRLRGLACGEFVFHVNGDLQIALEKLDELAQIKSIAPRGVRTESALINEVGQEAFDDGEIYVHGGCLSLPELGARTIS